MPCPGGILLCPSGGDCETQHAFCSQSNSAIACKYGKVDTIEVWQICDNATWGNTGSGRMNTFSPVV